MSTTISGLVHGVVRGIGDAYSDGVCEAWNGTSPLGGTRSSE